MKMAAPLPVDGGSSPMVKPKGDKQVEYLDLDLESGKSTPPRKVGDPAPQKRKKQNNSLFLNLRSLNVSSLTSLCVFR